MAVPFIIWRRPGRSRSGELQFVRCLDSRVEKSGEAVESGANLSLLPCSPPSHPATGTAHHPSNMAACSLASVSFCVLLSPACGACSSPSPFPKPLIHPSALVSGFPAPGKPPWMHQAGSAPVAPGTYIYISTCHTPVNAFLTCLATRLQAL